MNNLCGKDFLTGPFDECLECQYLRNGCSGPRTNAMEHPRWVYWIKCVMKRFGISQTKLANDTDLSKSTVDDIFAGRRQDISRNTARIIENYVLGDGIWPCAKKLTEGKDIVYEDRPETLEMLKIREETIREKDTQIENLRSNYNNLRASYDYELKTVREEHREDIKVLRERIDWLVNQSIKKDEQLAHKDVQMARKDDYIDRLAKKVGL